MPRPEHSLASIAPAMLQWSRNDETQYLGVGRPVSSCSIVADFSFNAAQHTALLRFRVHVWLKGCPRKVVVTILVHPAKLRAASRLETEQIPPLVTNSFVGRVEQCTSAQHVFPLRIVLHDPAGMKIFAPSNVTDVVPNTKPSGRILDALRSLSYVHDFVLYLPTSPELTGRIDAFCDHVANRPLGPSGRHYNLSSLYGGLGGLDISSRLQAGTSDSPPRYDGPGLEIPSAKRSPSSPINSPPPSKKQSLRDDSDHDHDADLEPEPEPESEPEPKPDLQTWTSRLLQLELQVSALRGRLAARPDDAVNDALGTPTEDMSMADRFERFDDQVRALNEHMDALQSQMRQDTASRDEQFSLLREQMREIQLRQREDQYRREREMEETERTVDELMRNQPTLPPPPAPAPAPAAEAEAETQAETEAELIPPALEEALGSWVSDHLYEHGWSETRDYFDDIIDDAATGLKVMHREWLEEQVQDDLPDMLNAALRRLLPDLLSTIELRVGFVGGAGGRRSRSRAGWLWRGDDGEVVEEEDWEE